MRTYLTTFLAILIAVLAAGVFAAELAAQRSSAAGVTVAVTPQNLSPAAKSWDFKIALDTHSKDLSDDLVKSAVLLDDKGGRHAPITWEGSGPGGHHREGVLRFKPVSPAPPAIELRISRPGEDKPRVFNWRLK
ncbi:MAG TPA: hypothetical protein VLC73_01805 [Burkholderiales bacterium]|nr:hypothetical protein [Burkholderiales bacterium]